SSAGVASSRSRYSPYSRARRATSFSATAVISPPSRAAPYSSLSRSCPALSTGIGCGFSPACTPPEASLPSAATIPGRRPPTAAAVTAAAFTACAGSASASTTSTNLVCSAMIIPHTAGIAPPTLSSRPPEPGAFRTNGRNPCQTPRMDELDSEIVRLLQADARLSNRELARRLGVAPSTCLERVRSLNRRGVIRGYHADIDLAALNRGVQALVSVQVRPLNRSVIVEFKDTVAGYPEVLSVFVLAGGDDFVLHVAVQDLDTLHGFLLDRLSKRPEIAGFRTSVIFQSRHNTVLERLPEA